MDGITERLDKIIELLETIAKPSPETWPGGYVYDVADYSNNSSFCGKRLSFLCCPQAEK
jgi:hypothetical protein